MLGLASVHLPFRPVNPVNGGGGGAWVFPGMFLLFFSCSGGLVSDVVETSASN